MSKSEEPKISHALIGAAGVHHVVSELCRRGIVALPTVRNVKAFDIVAFNKDGSNHSLIQVKSSSKKPIFWPLGSEPPAFMAADAVFYVFVRYDKKAQKYESFVVPGEVVVRQARQQAKEQIDRKGSRNWWSWYLNRDNNIQYLNRWDLLNLK